MNNIYWLLVSSVIFSSCNACADGKVLDVKDDQFNSLHFRNFNQSYGGWNDVEYSSVKIAFKLYAFPEKTDPLEAKVVVSSDIELMSPNKKYLLLQRTYAGQIIDDQGANVLSAQEYCDMVSLNDGCVKNIGSAQQCDGTWDGQTWKVSTGETFNFSKEGFPPQKLISNFSNLPSNNSRAFSLVNLIFMGIPSYMACYPPEKNVTEYNNIGFYLSQGGEHLLAIQIYDKLLSLAPSRVPLKLNMADSLWAVGKKDKAKIFYNAYRNGMLKIGRIDSIPARVAERVE